MSTAVRVTLIVIFAVLALIFFGAGFLYLHDQARHLPSILGRVQHAHYHRTKREVGSFIVGGIFLVAALLVAFLPRRPTPAPVVEPDGVASRGV